MEEVERESQIKLRGYADEAGKHTYVNAAWLGLSPPFQQERTTGPNQQSVHVVDSVQCARQCVLVGSIKRQSTFVHALSSSGFSHG